MGGTGQGQGRWTELGRGGLAGLEQRWQRGQGQQGLESCSRPRPSTLRLPPACSCRHDSLSALMNGLGPRIGVSSLLRIGRMGCMAPQAVKTQQEVGVARGMPGQADKVELGTLLLKPRAGEVAWGRVDLVRRVGSAGREVQARGGCGMHRNRD